ncbi:FAD-binding protein [Streptomyces sp. NPDC004783]|uniref:FAD-binding protein n=1 Tax=Streptomyces sp. NPDC004783 TaxID=3154459 RepID=UPI0033BAB7E0
MKEFSRDFGRTAVISPEKVVRDGDDGGVEDIMRKAAAAGQEMAVRGAGRSCNTQTLSPGIVLDNYRPDSSPEFTGEEHLVRTPSGITWLELEKWLNRHGRSNPVLPSYLGMTVGGNLSVGGFGLASVRCGLQSDQVVEIELVDGRGQSLSCSRRENSELFSFALGGLGQVGFIRSVVLRTVPYQPVTRAARIQHGGLGDLVDFMMNGAQDPAVSSYFGMYERDSWYSYVSLGPDAPEPEGLGETLSVPDYMLFSHRETEKQLHHLLEEDSHANMWVDHVFDEAGFRAFVRTVEDRVGEYPLSDTLVALYFLVIRRPHQATRFPLAPVVDAPVQYLIGIFTAAERSDARGISETRRVLRELLEACAEAKGRPYLYGTHDFDAGLLERFYGAPALERLEELRVRHALTHFNRRAFGGIRP